MAGTAYRTVPDRYLYDPDFSLADAQWDALQIPVGMAFFLPQLRAADDAVVACYPSPAGATESELDLSEFVDGVGAGRLGAMLEPDVEALLVRHDGGRGRSACSCPSTPATGSSAWSGGTGGASTAAPRRGSTSTASSTTPARGPRVGSVRR